MPAWTLHGLRRTVASHMAGRELKIARHVIDRLLNHQSGVIRGVAAVYNQYEYADEREAALDAWGRYLERLLYPERASNVVALPAR